MKNKYLFFIAFLALSSIWTSCNLYNPAEPVPAYIHIQKISVTTDASLEGSNSSKITDAWVYIDGKLVGIYELPATFPVIAEGSHQLLIKAGIKVNGISATRAPYPFYDSYKQTITLTAGTTSHVQPVVQYVSGLNWSSPNMWKEDFESSSGMTLDTSATGSDTNLYHYTIPSGTTHPNVFEGHGSGIAYIDAAHPKFEYMSSNAPFVLPRGDSPVFLEMNYKCNYDFVVGVFAHDNSGSNQYKVINVNASPNWNKIYIYMSPTVSAATNAIDFNVFFGMLNTSGSNGLYIALDNIKLVHY
jgi:hypothetical protein